MQKEKKDPNRIQQEEEKLKLLETARDQIFEEVHQVIFFFTTFL